MTRSSSMTSCPVLRCLAPRLPVLSVGFGSVFCSMPLGRIAGPPVTPLSLTIPARKSATTCFSAAFSASRRSVRASRSPRDSSERGIFSGTDMLGTNRVRYEQGQPRSSSYLPGFLPQVHRWQASHCKNWEFCNGFAELHFLFGCSPEPAYGLASSGPGQGNAFGTGRKHHPRADNLSEHRGGRSWACRRKTVATAMTGYIDLLFCTSDRRCG